MLGAAITPRVLHQMATIADTWSLLSPVRDTAKVAGMSRTGI